MAKTKGPAALATGPFVLYFYSSEIVEIVRQLISAGGSVVLGCAQDGGQRRKVKSRSFDCGRHGVLRSAMRSKEKLPPTLRFPTPASENRARRGPRFAQDGAPSFVPEGSATRRGSNMQPWIRSCSRLRSRALRVSDRARSNSVRASSKRPSLARRSPRTLGRRW